MIDHPIGIFDSGVGGLTVWRAVKERLPEESIIYFADQFNCPYGNKSKDEIRTMTNNCVKYLLDQQCKLIVIACNTATAVVIDQLREKYPDILFVGLEPAVKPAALNTQKLDYKNIDYLVLGCTHYPFMFDKLQKLCGDSVKIIDSAQAVARQAQKLLHKHNLISLSKNSASYQFLTTDNPVMLEQFLLKKHFIGLNSKAIVKKIVL